MRKLISISSKFSFSQMGNLSTAHGSSRRYWTSIQGQKILQIKRRNSLIVSSKRYRYLWKKWRIWLSYSWARKKRIHLMMMVGLETWCTRSRIISEVCGRKNWVQQKKHYSSTANLPTKWNNHYNYAWIITLRRYLKQGTCSQGTIRALTTATPSICIE